MRYEKVAVGLVFVVGLLSGTSNSASAAGVPQTGQTLCYDLTGAIADCAGTGQDGEILAGWGWPDPRYVDNAGQTVTDNLTGLMWVKDAGTPTVGACAGGAMNWQAALDYVSCLNANDHLGYHDWRLPNINELKYLISWGEVHADSWLNSRGFFNVRSANYWSSTTTHGMSPCCAPTTTAFALHMWGGPIYSIPKTTGNWFVFPVRSDHQGIVSTSKTGQTTSYSLGDDGMIQAGAPWPIPRFTNPDGTSPISGEIVKDQLSGIEWPRDASTPTVGTCSTGTMTWLEALNHVACLNAANFLGHNDWRLPNKNEVESLLHYGTDDIGGWLTSEGFANIQGNWLWSSSTYAPNSGLAWALNVLEADHRNVDDKTFLHSVWPVRGMNSITTGDVNQPPVLAAIGSKTANEGEPLQFTVTATDPDGDPLVFEAYLAGSDPHSLPEGAVFTGQTFSWTADYAQGGQTYDIVFSVRDVPSNSSDTEVDLEQVAITVGNVNRAPIFLPVGVQKVQEDQMLQFSVQAMDPDGDEVSYSCGPLPASAWFDVVTRTFSWTPGLSQAGNYAVDFQAQDSWGKWANPLEVSITVSDQPTPVELAQDIVVGIAALPIPSNLVSSYTANVKSVGKFVDEGKITPAINELKAFIHKIENDIDQGKINQLDGELLIQMASDLISVLVN